MTTLDSDIWIDFNVNYGIYFIVARNTVDTLSWSKYFS